MTRGVGVGLDGTGRVHVVGVGGAGMSAIAELVRGLGHRVSGTDRTESATLARLRALGVDARAPHDRTAVEDACLVVRSSAIPPDNPELVRATELGIPVIHRSEALALIAARDVVVAVAGSHGKTTTSAMVTSALAAGGWDPSYAIGAVVTGTGHGAAVGRGGVMVLEADESDGSFLAYRPDVGVVTNVEPDHLDHYGSLQAVEEAFVEFAATMRPGGVLVVCADDPGAARVGAQARRAGSDVITYGFTSGADARIAWEGAAENCDPRPRIRFTNAGGDMVTIALPMPGRHIALNVTAAYTAAVAAIQRIPRRLGREDEAALVGGLESFAGTARRFELRGEVSGVRVIDDYAHHPTEIDATVAAARTVAGSGRIVAVFQPHLYSRTAAFAPEFAAALAAADQVAVMDVYAAREQPVAGVDGNLIASRVPGAVHLPHRGDVADRLAGWARAGDIILTLGAGDVTDLVPEILASLAEHAEHTSHTDPEGMAS
ncbi:MAG: UDP-N-acetylmuramate--L-alanine ligase [Bifidobacteriaceae bacterium]|jgi:UDP-N-acetylmuramate--alanine ligase|nr:UDP-N-acetylmuramate--L-alanine ligase [Bifidobacteriaceae bacterium]